MQKINQAKGLDKVSANLLISGIAFEQKNDIWKLGKRDYVERRTQKERQKKVIWTITYIKARD